MSILKSILGGIAGIFTGSPKATAALNVIDRISQAALPIVQEIATITPNKTVGGIALAYETLGVPLVHNVAAIPESLRGYLLLDLATQVLAAKFPGTATNILNSAAQAAVSAAKAGGKA